MSIDHTKAASDALDKAQNRSYKSVMQAEQAQPVAWVTEDGEHMNTQTEAERLADLLEDWAKDYATTDFDCDMGDQAANELRRLHQSEREGWRYADELEQERKRLHAANQELLEALKLADALLWGANMNALIVERKVKAVIAKHGSQP